MDSKKHFITAWKVTLEFIVPLILMTFVMVVVSVITIGILSRQEVVTRRRPY